MSPRARRRAARFFFEFLVTLHTVGGSTSMGSRSGVRSSVLNQDCVGWRLGVPLVLESGLVTIAESVRGLAQVPRVP